MEKAKENYIEIICNFYNNLCGYMEKGEIEELINIIFNNEIDIKVDNELEEKINNCIIDDDSDELIKIFEEIRERVI